MPETEPTYCPCGTEGCAHTVGEHREKYICTPCEEKKKVPKLERPCEEASPMSVNTKIDCGDTAVAIVWHDRDQRAYRMCRGCADHNVRNRGGVLLYPEALS